MMSASAPTLAPTATPAIVPTLSWLVWRTVEPLEVEAAPLPEIVAVGDNELVLEKGVSAAVVATVDRVVGIDRFVDIDTVKGGAVGSTAAVVELDENGGGRKMEDDDEPRSAVDEVDAGCCGAKVAVVVATLSSADV